MPIDDEMLVGRHRVEADAAALHRPADAGQVLGEEGFDAGQVGCVELARIVQRIGDDCAAGVLGHFDAELVDLRKAVKDAVRQLVEIRRAAAGPRDSADRRSGTNRDACGGLPAAMPKSASSCGAQGPAVMISLRRPMNSP